MLATPFAATGTRLDTVRVPTGYVAEPKLDGIRAVWDGRALYSRDGRQLRNPPDVLAHLATHCSRMELDGELYGEGWGKTWGNVSRHAAAPPGSVTYHLFDITRHAEDGVLCGRTYDQRREILEAVPTCPVVCIVPMRPIDGRTAGELASEYLDAGFEGAVIKMRGSPYLPGLRSRHWLKVKETREAEGIIIAAELGEGRLNTTLGAITVEIEGRQLRVGSGFSNALRASLWAAHQRGQLLGLPVTIRFQPDKDIFGRFPTFLRLRFDLPREVTAC
jgi:DNA ligase-1